METKKSKKADLEAGRGKRLALGLAVALAVFLAVLNLPFHTGGWDDADEDWTEQDEDLDLKALLTHNEGEVAMDMKKADVADRLKTVPSASEESPEELDRQAEGDKDDGVQLAASDPEDNGAAQDIAPPGTAPGDNPLDFHVVEDLPQFPGGPVALMRWLSSNLTYPASARQRKVQGKVVAQFVVNRDGSLTDFKIVQSLDGSCDREAMRVLRLMPKWKAGVQHDKPCRTLVAIPIVFKL